MASRTLNWADLLDSDDDCDAPTTTTKTAPSNNTPKQEKATTTTVNNNNTIIKDVSPFTEANTSTNQLTDVDDEDDACRALVYDESTPSKQYREVTIGAAVPYTFKSVWNTHTTSSNSNSTGNTPSATTAESSLQQQQLPTLPNNNNNSNNNNTADMFRAAQLGGGPSSSFSPAHTTSFVSALLSNLPAKLSQVQNNNNNVATTTTPTSPLAATAPATTVVSASKGDAPVVVELRQLLSSTTDNNTNNNNHNNNYTSGRKSMPLAEVARQLQWDSHYASTLGPLMEFLRRHRGDFVVKAGCVSLVDINDRLLNELMRVQWGQK